MVTFFITTKLGFILLSLLESLLVHGSHVDLETAASSRYRNKNPSALCPPNFTRSLKILSFFAILRELSSYEN